MKSTFLRSLRLFSVPALGFAAAAFGGCSGADVESPADPGAPAASSGAMADYILHVQPSKRRVTLHRLSQAALKAQAGYGGPGLAPQVMADVNLVSDDVTGSNNGSTSNDTVELVTDQNSIVDTYNSAASGSCPANSFCADVTLNSFWTKTLNNTFAQITSLTDGNGMPLSGHSGTNSDSPRSSGLSASLGLWMYQSASVLSSHFSNGNSGVMLPGASNGATKTWVFANPDDADTYIQIKVWASTSYSSYTLTSRSTTYTDACTIGTGDVQLSIGSATSGAAYAGQPLNRNDGLFVQLPFDFTFWGKNYVAGDHLNFSKWGQITFGPTSYDSSAQTYSANMPSNATSMTQSFADSNTALPLTTSPRPAAFVFWDVSRAATSGSSGLCAKVNGTVPNRQVHISWYRLGLTGSGPYLTYGATLNESTDEIWFNYRSQTASTTYTATIGAQDDSGTTVATGSTNNVTSFPVGTSKVLLPLP